MQTRAFARKLHAAWLLDERTTYIIATYENTLALTCRLFLISRLHSVPQLLLAALKPMVHYGVLTRAPPPEAFPSSQSTSIPACC